MGALLEVKDFHYYYGNIHVVKGINLKVDKGEIVTLIGANGAGKTTTLQSISGLTPAAGVRGEIIYKGTPIQKMHGNKILRMGLSQVLEGRHIFSKLSVYENLMMGAYTRKDKAGIQEDLKRVYNLFPRLEERRAAPSPAASSRCLPSAGPWWQRRSLCFWTSPPWDWRPS